ncbi:hypothetical protein B0H16DRAFT_1807794 [Mycena metata]|uniref:Uncharacterized protein n=1 Tax=Mycena metata TaxID=1033252 RepID=A0AAD7H7T7_9AGAR|nr:hypothetical protein B0H16DRAFT_1807794 [Mycena metata]
MYYISDDARKYMGAPRGREDSRKDVECPNAKHRAGVNVRIYPNSVALPGEPAIPLCVYDKAVPRVKSLVPDLPHTHPTEDVRRTEGCGGIVGRRAESRGNNEIAFSCKLHPKFSHAARGAGEARRMQGLNVPQRNNRRLNVDQRDEDRVEGLGDGKESDGKYARLQTVCKLARWAAVLDGPAIRTTQGRRPTEPDGCTVALDAGTKTRGRVGVDLFAARAVWFRYQGHRGGGRGIGRRSVRFLLCPLYPPSVYTQPLHPSQVQQVLHRWAERAAKWHERGWSGWGGQAVVVGQNNAAQQCPQMGGRFHGQLVPVQCRQTFVRRVKLRGTARDVSFSEDERNPTGCPRRDAIGVRALGRITEASGISAMLREPSRMAENSQEYMGTHKNLMEHLLMTQNDWGATVTDNGPPVALRLFRYVTLVKKQRDEARTRAQCKRKNNQELANPTAPERYTQKAVASGSNGNGNGERRCLKKRQRECNGPWAVAPLHIGTVLREAKA